MIDSSNSNVSSTEESNAWLEYPTGKIPRGSFCSECARYNARNICSHAIVVDAHKIVLVKRNHNPMKGYWALPAGYLSWDETLEAAALRELKEETGIIGSNPQLLGIYSDPSRDQDGRQNVGVVYRVTFEAQSVADTPEEVAQVEWFSLDLLPDTIAFDHRQMIEDFKKGISK